MYRRALDGNEKACPDDTSLNKVRLFRVGRMDSLGSLVGATYIY